MANVKSMARPKGQSNDYRFYKNNDSGNSFKAKHEFRRNVAEQPVLAISVSRVDATGKAIVEDGAEAPDVVWHTHTFTLEELSDPAFDADARLATIMDSVITAQETVIASKAQLKALAANWSK